MNQLEFQRNHLTNGPIIARATKILNVTSTATLT